AGCTSREPPCGGVRAEAEFVHCCLNLGTCAVRDSGGSVDDAADGGDADPGALGDVVDCRGHERSWKRRNSASNGVVRLFDQSQGTNLSLNLGGSASIVSACMTAIHKSSTDNLPSSTRASSGVGR